MYSFKVLDQTPPSLMMFFCLVGSIVVVRLNLSEIAMIPFLKSIVVSILSLSFVMQTQPTLARPLTLDVKNDGNKDAELDSYIAAIEKIVEERWCDYPPPSNVSSKISFYIEKDGTISGTHLLTFDGLETAALTTVSAIVQSAPYSKPPIRNNERIEVTAVFHSAELESKGKDFCQRFFDLKRAREYSLALINRDRTKERLSPVALDETANRAGQWHSAEMARDRYTNHWNAEGQTPPLRYCLSGGFDYVSENAQGSTNLPDWRFELAPNQLFSRQEIEQAHMKYLNSAAHRANIFAPEHSHVGLGFSLVNAVNKRSGLRLRQIYCTQEFLNRAGSYNENSSYLKRFSRYKLKGMLEFPSQLQALVLREDFPKRVSLKKLRTTEVRPYRFPSEQKLNIRSDERVSSNESKLEINGSSFQLTITPRENWPPGRYYIVLMANDQNGKQFPICVRVLDCH